jgi:hypothetical protein
MVKKMSSKKYNFEPQELGHTIQTLNQSIVKGNKILEISDYSEITDELRIEYNDSIILKPDYQRDYRSTIAEESSLIESVLLGIPIPPVFLASNKMYNIQVLNVVDGQHRLRAFFRFINNEFELKELPILKKLVNKKFEDLDLTDKQKILSHKLPSYVFRDFPGKEYELEVFNRYNKGTKPLSPQEIRNAVYNSSYNEYVNLFINRISKSKEVDDIKLKVAYNITTDRQLKKKVHETIFVILYILEFGINVNFKDSTMYAEEYMKAKSEHDDATEFEKVRTQFEKFNKFLLIISENIKFPFSKEIYGVESRNYKFQMSIAMIIAAIYRKEYSILNITEIKKESILEKIKDILLNSFLEDPDYKASTTNSKKLDELVNNF